MIKYLSALLFYVSILSVGMVSCKLYKRSHNAKVIVGYYKITKQEHYDSDGNALVIGSVYDKEHNTPILGAMVNIKEINKGALADSVGSFTLKVSGGTYRIEAINVGNTTLVTDPIKLDANIKTEIQIYLGTIHEYSK